MNPSLTRFFFLFSLMTSSSVEGPFVKVALFFSEPMIIFFFDPTPSDFRIFRCIMTCVWGNVELAGRNLHDLLTFILSKLLSHVDVNWRCCWKYSLIPFQPRSRISCGGELRRFPLNVTFCNSGTRPRIQGSSSIKLSSSSRVIRLKSWKESSSIKVEVVQYSPRRLSDWNWKCS